MNVLLLVNGELYRPDILRERIAATHFDRVIGVDGGSRYAGVLGLTADTVIGDMDSLPKETEGNPVIISHPVKKDKTDLELALVYAREQGAERIVMVAATGGRLDMTAANILLLTRERLGGCRVELWDGRQTAWLVRPPGEEIAGNPGDTVSFLPLAGHASGITEYNFVYPLNDATLAPGETRGVSNIIATAPARISFSSGVLLAVHTPGDPDTINGGTP